MSKKTRDETLQLIDLSLQDRFAAGQTLLAAGERDAAIYLFGYAAEMVLKSAYFRFQQTPLTATIDTLLPPAKASGKLLIPHIAHEGYHSLQFWAELLRETRRQQGRVLPPQLDASFVGCCQRLYERWWVEMRYHPNQATPTEAVEVEQDVAWLVAQRVDLWR